MLVCCTDGAEGEILNPALDTPEVRADLAAVRRRNWPEATEVIGYDEVVMLGYRDSGMAGSEANANPDCFAAAPLDEATGRLVAIIRRTRPQVMVIYGDDQSGYPHPDHLRVHEAGLAAFRAAGDPTRYPGAGTALPAGQALLHRPLGRPVPGHPRQVRGAGPRVAVRRRVAGPVGQDARRGADHASSTSPATPTCAATRCWPTPPRSTRVQVLVRAAARGDGAPSSPTTTTGWRSSATPTAPCREPTWDGDRGDRPVRRRAPGVRPVTAPLAHRRVVGGRGRRGGG